MKRIPRTEDLQAVVFDFDYTLADSSRAVIECANTALRGMGLEPASEDAIRRTIGLSLPETLVRLAGEQHRNRADEFRRLWRAKSLRVMVDWTTLLPGVPVAIEALRNLGLCLGIVSTKFRSPIQAVLRRENLFPKFDAIIGGDDVKQFKPDPEGLLLAINQLGAEAGSTLYVGDNVTDAETARRAGVPFLAVLSGVTSRDEFSGYSVLEFLESVGHLPSFLAAGVT